MPVNVQPEQHAPPGSTVLITGASSGIGAAFAQALAQRGVNLVLVARSAEKLDATARELHDAHGVTVDVIAQDLADAAAPPAVATALGQRGLQVDLLVNNAGFATQGTL